MLLVATSAGRGQGNEEGAIARLLAELPEGRLNLLCLHRFGDRFFFLLGTVGSILLRTHGNEIVQRRRGRGGGETRSDVTPSHVVRRENVIVRIARSAGRFLQANEILDFDLDFIDAGRFVHIFVLQRRQSYGEEREREIE